MSGAAIHKLLTAVFITSLIGIFFSGISLAIGNRWSFVEIKNPTRDAGEIQFFFGPQTFCRKFTGSQVATTPNQLICFDWEEPSDPLNDDQQFVKGHMRAAWGFVITSVLLSTAAAIEAGVLTYSAATIKAVAFRILAGITGVGFLCALIAMGLATAANNGAAGLLKVYRLEEEDFSFNAGWCLMIIGFFFSLAAFVCALCILAYVHRLGGATPAAPAREANASARRVTKNPVEDFA